MSMPVSSPLRAPEGLHCLQSAHHQLFDQLVVNEEIRCANSPAQQDWLDAVADFFGQVKKVAKVAQHDRDAATLEWVARTASQWQMAMSESLQLPRNVRDEIGLDRPAAVVAEPDACWNGEFVRACLSRHAYSIGTNRKLIELLQRVERLQLHPHRIHIEIPSSPAERWADWYDACLFFALDVILGRVDFASFVHPSAYEFLETVWLDDVKRLLAYLYWEESGGDHGSRGHRDCYFLACDEINRQMFGPPAQVDETCFELVHSWWKERFQIATTSGQNAFDGISIVTRQKARRIWERDKHRDAVENWKTAESYVQKFYCHLIPAVLHENRDDIRLIHQAMRPSSPASNAAELVNGLEAAIAAAFIDFTALDKA